MLKMFADLTADEILSAAEELENVIDFQGAHLAGSRREACQTVVRYLKQCAKKHAEVKKKERRFEVWTACNHAGAIADTEILTFGPEMTEKQINEVLQEQVDTMIGNNFDTGWRELHDDEEKDR